MENNSKNRRLAIAIMLVAVVLITIGGTFAYFITQAGRNEEQKLTIKTGNLALTFEDNDDGLNERIMIGESVEKLFIIRNTGTQPVTTNMIWDGLVNTYIEESLSYTLEYKSSDDGTYQSLDTAHENVPQSDRANDYNLAKNITIPAGETYYYKLTITFNNLPDVNQEADRTAILSTKFNLGEEIKEIGQGVKKLLKKSNSIEIENYANGNKKEMYTFNQEASEQTPMLTDFRYIGSEPNNYIVFNNEIWRIIGVFSNNDETKIKIMRNISIGNIAWDSNGNNDWEKSSLKEILNNDYYNRLNDFSENGLNTTAKEQIALSTWFLGAYTSSEQKSAKTYYSVERGLTTCFTEKKCGNQIRKVKINANIGLIYPSEYAYTFALNVNKICFDDMTKCFSQGGGQPINSWIFNIIDNFPWTISTYSTDSLYTLFIYTDGRINYGNFSNVINKQSIFPTLYLRSDIKIIDGDGSETNPYVLEN